MGGHALKKVIASRISLAQYNWVKDKLAKKLNNLNSLLIFEFLIDVPGKTDFGDIDILYQVVKEFNIVELIKEIFNPIEIVSNGDVCSFAFEINNDLDNDLKVPIYFQVDLIKCVNIDASLFYFSYGDLGGILGRIACAIGLKFGNAGLWISPNSCTINKFINSEPNAKLINDLVFNLSTQLNLNNQKEKNKLETEFKSIIESHYPNIILSEDPKSICEYLGLDWDIWNDGFSSKQEIFEWIIKSRYFNLDHFRSLDYAHRQREKKRPMYQEFIKFIFKDEPEFVIEKTSKIKYSGLNLQLDALEYFNKSNEMEIMIRNECICFIRKKKFNGNKFIKLGIIDKQIPIYIKEFKKTLGFDNNLLKFNEWLDSMSSNDIDIIINKFVLERQKILNI